MVGLSWVVPGRFGCCTSNRETDTRPPDAWGKGSSCDVDNRRSGPVTNRSLSLLRAILLYCFFAILLIESIHAEHPF